jgi:hypothetical protein
VRTQTAPRQRRRTRAATASATGTWRTLGGGTIREVMPPDLPPGIWGSGSPNSITNAWNSGAYHPARHQFFVWGGGHADGAYNGVFCYDFASETWSRYTEPSMAFPPMVEGGAFVTVYSDGTPAATHTYDTQLCIGDEYLCTYSGSVWSGSGWRSNIAAYLHLETKQWRIVPIPGNAPELGRSMIYDPVQAKLVYRDEAYTYGVVDIHTGAVTYPYGSDTEGTYDGYTSVLVPTCREMVTLGSHPANPALMLVLALDSVAAARVLRPGDFTGPAPEIFDTYGPGLAWDARREVLVAWKGGPDVYEIDVPARAVVKVTGGGTPPGAREPNGTFTRFSFLPATGAFALVNTIDDPVSVYTPAGGDAPEPPDPAPEPGVLTAEWTAIAMNRPGWYASWQIGGKHGRMAFRPVDERIYCMGGDWYSADNPYEIGSGNNEVWSYSVAANDWRREFPQTPGPCAGPGVLVPAHPDETSWVYDPVRDVFHAIVAFWFGTATYQQACPGTQAVMGWGHLIFNPTTHTWTQGHFVWPPPIGGPGGDSGPKSGVYDPVRAEVIRLSPGTYLQRWNAETGAIDEPYITGDTIWVEQDQIALDAAGRRIYVVDYGGRTLWSVQLDTLEPKKWAMPAQYVWATDLGVPEAFDGNLHCLTYDPDARVLVLPNIDSHGGYVRHLFVFHVDTEQWEELPITHPAGTTVNGNTLVYDPVNRAHVLIGGRVTPHQFVLRLVGGAAPPEAEMVRATFSIPMLDKTDFPGDTPMPTHVLVSAHGPVPTEGQAPWSPTAAEAVVTMDFDTTLAVGDYSSLVELMSGTSALSQVAGPVFAIAANPPATVTYKNPSTGATVVVAPKPVSRGRPPRHAPTGTGRP